MKNLSLLITSLFLVLMTASPVVQGDLYKWVDKNGKIRYGDSPPENVKLRKMTGNISSFSSVSVEPFVYDPNFAAKRKKSRSIIMYSTSWCKYCNKAVRYFKHKKIPFIEYDIEKSAKAAREFKKLRGRGVPVILIGNRRMNGFSIKAFNRIYYAKS